MPLSRIPSATSQQKATIEIEMDNAAFADDPGAELACILRNLAGKIECGATERRLLDTNGNHVGDFVITP